MVGGLTTYFGTDVTAAILTRFSSSLSWFTAPFFGLTASARFSVDFDPIIKSRIDGATGIITRLG